MCVFLLFRFLATGESYRSLSFSFRLGRSTVHSIIPEVCEVLWTRLVGRYMQMPREPNDFKVIGSWEFREEMELSSLYWCYWRKARRHKSSQQLRIVVLQLQGHPFNHPTGPCRRKSTIHLHWRGFVREKQWRRRIRPFSTWTGIF